MEASEKYTADEIKKDITDMERDPFYIYINGLNPNCEELTFENKEGQKQTLKRQMIQFNSSGNRAVIGTDYEHSMSGRKRKGTAKGKSSSYCRYKEER